MTLLAAIGRLLLFAHAARAVQPGHSTAHHCCSDRHVRFAMHDYTSPPYYNYDPASSRPYSGFIPALIDAVAAETGITYDLVPTANPPMGTPLSFDPTTMTLGPISRTSDLATGIVDVDNIPITNDMPAFRMLDILNDAEFVITSEVVQTFTTGLLYKETLKSRDLIAIFEPFSFELWIGLIIALLTYTLLLQTLSYLAPGGSAKEPKNSTRQKAMTMAGSSGTGYHILISCFGDDYEWNGGPKRMLKLSYFACILILVSTYTAKLASFFTKPMIKIHGPRSRGELAESTGCVRDAQTGSLYQPYIKSFIYPPWPPVDPEVASDQTAYFNDWCMAAIRNGSADVWMNTHLSLHTQHLARCNETEEANLFEILPTAMRWVLRKNDTYLANALTVALLHIKSSPLGVDLRDSHFRSEMTCLATELSASPTEPVSLHSMGVLFIISGSTALLALLYGIIERHQYTKRQLRSSSTIAAGDTGPVDNEEAEEPGQARIDYASDYTQPHTPPVKRFAMDHNATVGELMRVMLARVDKLAEKQDLMQAQQVSFHQEQYRSPSASNGGAKSPTKALRRKHRNATPPDPLSECSQGCSQLVTTSLSWLQNAEAMIRSDNFGPRSPAKSLDQKGVEEGAEGAVGVEGRETAPRPADLSPRLADLSPDVGGEGEEGLLSPALLRARAAQSKSAPPPIVE